MPKTLLDEITEPGAYVCRPVGDLIRVVQNGASLDDAELIEKHGTGPMYVTRISEDPFISISRARIIAANLDIEVHF
ncbi:MAG: hypothetical protein JXQ75_14185 [Phycisphaerae bacterium]|nr:hypothetical protein [Phycisphaerae bacterium]